jgi:hypothetical protein
MLVHRAQQTIRDAARLACARLEEDGIFVLGTILTDWNPRTAAAGYRYDRYSSYSYGSTGGDV